MSEETSFVYKNIYIYRVIMNVLYAMKYRRRFKNIINLISSDDKEIVELCFGDIYIAQYASQVKKKWLGLDINDQFVSYAKNQGFDALKSDVLYDLIPESDVCIMSGSLYHFVDSIEQVLKKMLESSSKVIISEPIKNLSTNKYIGFLAKRCTNAGKGSESFRFTEASFFAILDRYKDKLSFSYKVISCDRDALVVLECI